MAGKVTSFVVNFVIPSFFWVLLIVDFVGFQGSGTQLKDIPNGLFLGALFFQLDNG